MPKNTIIQHWPGGVPTLAGGTRTAIKLTRPWQMRGPVADHLTCPLEPNRLQAAGETILSRSEDERWMSIAARFTPYDEHVMIVPKTCANWPEEKVRLLGGETEIAMALRLAHQFLANKSATKLMTINIGWLAGQNLSHLHWHVFTLPYGATKNSPRQAVRLLTELTDNNSLLIRNDDYHIFAGGHRAGQCFILPKATVPTESLARILASLVELYAKKFQSTAGEKLAPDFTIGLVFDSGCLAYGTYVPILNAWGSTEYLAILGQQPAILPWPHQLTAAYLRDEIIL